MSLVTIVQKALKSQVDLLNEQEKMAVSQETCAKLGISPGMQLRVSTSPSNTALYTAILMDGGGAAVRMGAVGRSKLGASGDFSATLDATVTRSGLSDSELKTKGELGERLAMGGSFLMCMAPHGGDNEVGTAEQAAHLAERFSDKGSSYWLTLAHSPKGASVSAHERWHITSSDISRVSFPYLATALSQLYQHAVAFHGHAESYILVGGGTDDATKSKMAVSLRLALPDIEVRVAGRTTTNGGNDPRNMLNLATAGGRGSIQLEQPREVRLTRGLVVADAVASVVASL